MSIHEEANRLYQLAQKIPVEKIQQIGEEIQATIREAISVMGRSHAYDLVMNMLADAERAQGELLSAAAAARQTLEETGGYHLGG